MTRREQLISPEENPWNETAWGVIFDLMGTEELQRYLDWVASSLERGVIGIHEVIQVKRWMIQTGREDEADDEAAVAWYTTAMKESILRWYDNTISKDDIMPPDQTL